MRLIFFNIKRTYLQSSRYYCCNPLDIPVFDEGYGVVNKTVIEGEDITLSCNFTGNPGEFSYGFTYSLADNLDLDDHGFRIKNITLNNAGRYHCFARNSVEESKLTFNLIVIGEIDAYT